MFFSSQDKKLQDSLSLSSEAEAPRNTVSVESLTAAVAELATGAKCTEYLVKPDLVSRTLRPLTVAFRARATSMLQTVVNIWVEQTRPLFVIAEMIRDMRELEKRSQAMAAASEEMMASINEMSRSAEIVSQDAQSVKDELTSSVNQVNHALSSMEGISGAFNALTDKVQTLDKASEQIAAILKTIEKIAAQTNLLALNATIEAARAGDAGKGFAVVASEVKTLAKQTSGATEDIRQRIMALQGGMSDMLQSMNDGATRVAEGKDVIGLVNNSIHSVGTRMDTVTGKMVEVTQTIKEQTTAVHEVTSNIGIVADMSQRVLGNCEKVEEGIQRSSAYVQSGLAEVSKNLDTAMLIIIAMSDHATFKKRVLDTILGNDKVRSTDLANHHNCRLGKWYEADAPEEIRAMPVYKKLMAPHERVHLHGRKALEAIEAHDFNGALAEAKQMDEASHEVIEMLQELHHAYSEHHKELFEGTSN